MRTRMLATAVGVLLALAPSAGVADHGSSDAVTISGHVRDVLGNPVRACVTAYGPRATPYSAISDSETGAYAVDVPPGRYDVWATDVVDLSGPRCPFDGSTFWHLEPAHRSVNTLWPYDPIDFELAYNIGGGVWGDVCCIKSAAKPGAQVQLYAQTDLRAADAIEVIWTANDTGESITVPRWPNFWKEAYGIAGFEEYFTIPLDWEDGVYTWTFSSVGPDGLRVTDEFSHTTIIDSIAPEIVSTYPADGAVMPLEFYPTISAIDSGAGVSDFRTRMKLWDLTTGAPPTNHYSFRTYSGTTRGDLITLEPGHEYEATFSTLDHANNGAELTVGFTASGGGAFGEYGPVDAVTDPHAPVWVEVGDDLDPSTLLMRVSHVVGQIGTVLEVKPNYDPETGRAWIDPVDEAAIGQDGKMPRLIPGSYRAQVRARHAGTGRWIELEWQFLVRAN